jgi:hypothetical protein
MIAAMIASTPHISPANKSQAEKFCHMRLVVCQKAMSVASARVKLTKGMGTNSLCKG